MTRALLVCPEPLAHKQPAGIGIRFLEMARVLRADGHEVTVLSPDGGGITPERIQQLTAAHDVAVVQGHIANELFAHGHAIPTVVDLYDPFIIENLHYHASRGEEVFAHDHATLMQSLQRGDFFLCASAAQRFFYLGALLAVGRFNPEAFESDRKLDALIAVAPFGVPPPRAHALRDINTPRVLFGGIYDWYDPILAIEAVALARERLPAMTLTFNTHPNPELTPQGKLAEAMEHVRRKRYAFVQFESWVQYDQRADYYDRFSVALLTFPQSIETDLSMRTRVFDYLWGGLPIVTSSAPGTDEILTRYGAGVVVHSDSPDEFADALVRALAADLTGGAAQFVEEQQWSRALEPLVKFVRRPRAADHSPIPERPSILTRIKRRIGGSL
ncbi:MAG: glycosyltransferase family 4 protein [Thermoanaerobaculia bacterium]